MKFLLQFFLALCVINLCAFSVAHANTRHSVVCKGSELMVLSAREGQVKQLKHGQYQLILRHVSHNILWFSDRPVRRAGFFPRHVLISNWKHLFKTSHPNAAMVHGALEVDSRHVAHAVPVELGSMYFKHGVMVFDIKGLSRAGFSNITIRDIHLFIDNVNLNPAIIDAVTTANVKVLGEAPAISMGNMYQ